MKKLTIWLYPALLLLATACKKDNDRDPPEQLIVNKTSISLHGYTGTIDSFTIQYSGTWTVTAFPTTSFWMEVSKTSGKGNATIYVKTLYTNTGVPQTATLHVVPDNAQDRRVEIAVTQNTFAPFTWGKVFGGSSYELFTSIVPTPEGGYIAAGNTQSVDGDATGNHGSVDIFVVKMDATGNAIWKKTYGGKAVDEAYSIIPAHNGGYIIAGTTLSNDGDVTGHKASYDVWIIKIDGNGSIVWQKTYGGSMWEKAHAIVPTADNGYLVGAYSDSRDGDVTGQHIDTVDYTNWSSDVWLLKLDISGNLQWQKTYGGKWDEECYTLTKTADGGYLAAGSTRATTADGDVQQISRGEYDICAFKVDANGNLQWQKSYGGSKSEFALTVISTPGGFMFCGGTESNDGQVTGNHGSSDAWIVKTDLSGNMVWQKTFGGKWHEAGWYMLQDGNDFIFSGDAESNDGTLTGNTDSDGSWIVKIDGNGNIIWHRVFGGVNDDNAGTCIVINPDKSYTVVANTTSNNGNMPAGHHGFYDAWVYSFKY